jgi:hypothetical protein
MSQDKSKGKASVEMFFSDFRAFVDATAVEANNLLKRIERVNKVTWSLSIFLQFWYCLGSPPEAWADSCGAGPGFLHVLTLTSLRSRSPKGGLICTTDWWPVIIRPRLSAPTWHAS